MYKLQDECGIIWIAAPLCLERENLMNAKHKRRHFLTIHAFGCLFVLSVLLGVPTPCVNSSVCQFQSGREKSSARQPYSRPRKWISAWCGSCSQPFFLTATAASHGNLIPLYPMQYMTAVSILGFNYFFNKGQAFVHTEMTGRYCWT